MAKTLLVVTEGKQSWKMFYKYFRSYNRFLFLAILCSMYPTLAYYMDFEAYSLHYLTLVKPFAFVRFIFYFYVHYLRAFGNTT